MRIWCNWIIPHARRVQRYALSLGKTLCLLWQWRNQVVIAQNPSIMLSLLCVVLQPVLRYRLVIDAHNAGFSPKKAIVSGYKIADLIIRNTAYTIVTNTGMAKLLKPNKAVP